VISCPHVWHLYRVILRSLSCRRGPAGSMGFPLSGQCEVGHFGGSAMAPFLATRVSITFRALSSGPTFPSPGCESTPRGTLRRQCPPRGSNSSSSSSVRSSNRTSPGCQAAYACVSQFPPQSDFASHAIKAPRLLAQPKDCYDDTKLRWPTLRTGALSPLSAVGSLRRRLVLLRTIQGWPRTSLQQWVFKIHRHLIRHRLSLPLQLAERH
jgi:hypothetical protein